MIMMSTATPVQSGGVRAKRPLRTGPINRGYTTIRRRSIAHCWHPNNVRVIPKSVSPASVSFCRIPATQEQLDIERFFKTPHSCGHSRLPNAQVLNASGLSAISSPGLAPILLANTRYRPVPGVRRFQIGVFVPSRVHVWLKSVFVPSVS